MAFSDIYQMHHAEKHRLGFSVLEEERAAWFLAHTPKGGDWLDVGCRDGTLTRHFMANAASMVGIDIDPSALAEARLKIPNGAFLSVDLTGSWSELDGRMFDVIVCSEVLEHVYFPDKVVAKIGEHLKPGGVFVGSVPNAFFLKHRARYLFGTKRGTPLDDPTHITQFHLNHLRRILSQIGKPTIGGYTKPPFAGLAERYPGLFAWDFLFQVKKV